MDESKISNEEYGKEHSEIIEDLPLVGFSIQPDGTIGGADSLIERGVDAGYSSHYIVEYGAFKENIWPQFKSLYELMKQFPPLLSVDHPNRIFIQEKFTIYDSLDPSKEWLSVKKGQLEYSWMFKAPFQPQGRAHFIVVDLLALANGKRLETMKN